MTSQIHNGIHALSEEPFVEWWYFNFVSENEYVFNFLLHSTNVFGGKKHDYISVSMITPDKKRYYFKTEINKCVYQGCQSSLNINTDKLILVSSQEGNLLNIRFKCKFDGLMLDGYIKGTSGLYTPNGGLLFNKNDKNIHWIIPIPNGDFDLKMTLFDKVYDLKGNVYHDHDWGNLLLEEAFKGWIWMHLYFENGHLTMHNVVDKNDNENMNCYLVLDNEKYVYKSGKIKPLDWKNSLTTNFEIYMNFESNKSHKNVKIEINECDAMREHFTRFYDYHRSALNCDIMINSENVNSKGVYEHLVIKS